MDIAILAQTALTLAAPFLNKIGEGTSRKIGEDVWSLIKKPFNAQGKELAETTEHIVLKADLEQMLGNDESFKKELEEFVTNAQSSSVQQTIQNNAAIEKQVNITSNSGNLNF